MSLSTRRILFLLFFVSGFCSLLYQVVWTRMAFAAFGIITPVLSVVISMFMLGLSVGSWAGGKFISRLTERTKFSAIIFYATAELIIGLGAFSVPRMFAAGEHWLLGAGQTDSFRYLSLSALVLATAILPWCLCMGTTFPFMLAYVREREQNNPESFSYLYLANVLGAMSGTLLTAIVLVEVFGFHDTLRVAAANNFIIALVGLCFGCAARVKPAPVLSSETPDPSKAERHHSHLPGRLIKWILFTTGFSSMGMEVAWARAFTPALKTQVYSFAMIVFAYLLATFVGSFWYRRHLRSHSVLSTAALISRLTVLAFLPDIINDPRLLRHLPFYPGAILLLASICPFCALLGYMTPKLIDEYAAGDPAGAGRAYALNVVGCILGPLAASYFLLPVSGERYTLIFLGLPFFIFYLLCHESLSRKMRVSSGLAAAAASACALFISKDLADFLPTVVANVRVQRDYAATVISAGEGMDKQLYVNGIGMTSLTPITKFMVHLPLAFHRGKPESALIICFGMGTTYRSALSWNIETTAVELVPSVKTAFDFYYADAARFLANPKGRIIVDDGRRYLERTHDKVDVIVIDPPPPVEAAGSSLLYSEEFYALAKQHLKPNGILQAWLPYGDSVTTLAFLRSIQNSFPHVRCFSSVSMWGLHVLASMDPIEFRSAEELAARFPEAAKADLLEWTSSRDLPGYIRQVLFHEINLADILNPDPEVRITDDHPYNEYFLLRSWHLY